MKQANLSRCASATGRWAEYKTQSWLIFSLQSGAVKKVQSLHFIAPCSTRVLPAIGYNCRGLCTYTVSDLFFLAGRGIKSEQVSSLSLNTISF
jgi:hypothetical protein